jgi:hypothetical protein
MDNIEQIDVLTCTSSIQFHEHLISTANHKHAIIPMKHNQYEEDLSNAECQQIGIFSNAKINVTRALAIRHLRIS